MGEATVPAEQPAPGQAARVSAQDVDASRPSDPAGTAAQGPQSAVRLIWRLRTRDEFRALDRGRRFRRGPLTVTFTRDQLSDAPWGARPARVGYAIGRSAGSAAVRNRLRRRLRAIVQTLELVPGVYLIGVSREATVMGFGQLSQTLGVAIADVTAGATSTDEHRR